MQRKIADRQFKVLIERDDDGYFVASVPALPGCYTQARTLSELMERIRDAIKLCLEVAKASPRYREKIKNFSHSPVFIGMDVVSV